MVPQKYDAAADRIRQLHQRTYGANKPTKSASET